MIDRDTHVCALVLTLAAACVWDIRCRRIPNPLIFAALLLAVLIQADTHGWSGIATLLCGVAVASIALAPYAAGMIGAGDVKLLWVVGALTGPRFAEAALLSTALAGGALAGMFAHRYRSLKIPYGAAIAIGTLFTLWLRHGVL